MGARGEVASCKRAATIARFFTGDSLTRKGRAMRKLAAVLLVMGIPLFFLAANAADEKDETLKAVVVLHPTEGSKAHGSITFTQKGDTVEIKGKVMGLK